MSSIVLKIDESQWVVQIQKTLDEELEKDTKIPVSIFSVPKSLLAWDPDSYTPQQIPIGPYHYWRPEMYEMERYKVAAAKRMEKQIQNKFEVVVGELSKYETRIRACYDKYLTSNDKTLAWMMAIDACFMLEFLQIYGEEGKELHKTISSRMSHLFDVTGKKAKHNATFRDLMMLENQIPLFVLRKMLETRFSSVEIADEKLFSMLTGFYQVLSPFMIMEELTEGEAMQCYHLLDVLYHLIVPKFDKLHRPIPRTRAPKPKPDSGESAEGATSFNKVWKIVKKLYSSKFVLFIKQLPSTIISNIPGLSILKEPLEACFSIGIEEYESESGDSTNDNKPPLIDEISIPSVTALSKASVNVMPADDDRGIASIKFDRNTSTLYLPAINLDENSVVLLKNLVAYEACLASGPLIFTRYTELMNGIIDTEEDVKLLREKGIILNRLKSDEEVAKLWNGMNRSVRLTKAPFLDKVIRDVNRVYSGRWKVKVRNFVRVYVFGSWQFLTFLACVALMLFIAFQAFCDIHGCRRLFYNDVRE